MLPDYLFVEPSTGARARHLVQVRHRLKRRTDALLASDDRAYDEADALKRYTDRGGRVSGRLALQRHHHRNPERFQRSNR